ncbi:glycoside hydrolase family 97 protein [Flavobacteriaceae bacterium XHP0103]|uniref:glycoside hydrolase family 97 protein n=1 Tax=Marixanthotalea marina TaxID=2844359 RepID=UPI002989CCEC|nr:glycoside hydrolase family 97 catalytic domain-containing protein [Marixanthotalea marina]MBU3821820.1 glycoside hydrolase family 97 protein [Marixanthotalea marina]
MKFKICILFLLFGCLKSLSQSNIFTLQSPNKKVQLNISNKDNASQISAIFLGDTIIKPSVLGLKTNTTDFTTNVSYSNVSENTFDDTWNTVNGKYLTVRNHYVEYKFKVINKLNNKEQFYEIVFRLYDEGFAYNYNFPNNAIKDSVLIEKELTQLNFINDYTYWAYNDERHNLGPIVRSEKPIENVKTPAVMQLNNNRFMAIHEAEILSFAPFTLNASANDLSLTFNTEYSSRDTAFKTSWRTFILGEKVGDLVESNLLVNLNEPCKIEDTSWIKPGKSMWDWRVWGYKTQDGFQYELDTRSHKRLIDFASKNNVQYLLIDADWYGEEFNENSDPTTAKEGIDIEEAMRYAKEKNVGIILYLNDVGAKKFGLERVLKQFSDWGAVGVKYGFMTGSLEDKVKQTKKVIELCAQNKLMVDFHDGPIPPSGDRRTWPNMMTKEYGHAQADALRSHFPETSVNQVLINMIAGPLDLTNGWFDLNDAFNEKRPKVFQELPGTVVAEVAKLITIYTGWSVLPDSPEEYLDKDDLFDCIRKMPAQFDSLKILDAELDSFVSVARKAGDDWFIGSLTTRDPREISVDLSFLPKDKKYEATIYSDAEDAHFLNNKESYKIETQAVNSNSKLNIKMAPGGGNAIYIKNITSL